MCVRVRVCVHVCECVCVCVCVTVYMWECDKKGMPFLVFSFCLTTSTAVVTVAIDAALVTADCEQEQVPEQARKVKPSPVG